MVITSMKTSFAVQFRALSVAILALGLSSCSSTGSKAPWSDSSSTDYTLISQNLIDAVAQYPELDPRLATVQVADPDNAFERQVQKDLTDLGYKLERDGGDDAANIVSASIGAADIDDANSSLYTLSVGDLTAERHYAQVDGNVTPTSELVIRGAQARAVNVDDSAFEGVDATLTNVVFKADDVPVVTAAQPKALAPTVGESSGQVSSKSQTPEAKYVRQGEP